MKKTTQQSSIGVKYINQLSHSFIRIKLLVPVTILLVLLGLSSCAPWKEASFIDEDVDFSQYKSLVYYGWSKGSGSLIDEKERTDIEKAFGKEFRSRDIEIRTFEKEADLTVSLFLVLNKTTGQQAYSSHYSGGVYSGQPGFGSGFGLGYSGATFKEYDYVEGTLIVDVIDSKTKKLIWQGIGKGFIDSDAATRESNISASVARIMSPYPVKPKQ